MKKLLICTLLVINAIPANALVGADWCKGNTGCGSLTWLTDAMGATTVAKDEAARLKKQKEEQEAASQKAANSRLLKQEILIAHIDTTCTGSEQQIQELRERTGKEKEAIENELRVKAELLVAKLNECEQADLAACDDAMNLTYHIGHTRADEVRRLIAQNNAIAKRNALHESLREVKQNLPTLYVAFSETQEKQAVVEKQVTQEFVTELKKLDEKFNAKLEEILQQETKARAECFGNDENSNELGDASKATFSKFEDAKRALENSYETERVDLKAKYDGIKQTQLDPIFAEREAKKVELVDKQLAVIAYKKTLENLEDIQTIEKIYPRTRTVEASAPVVEEPAVETAPVIQEPAPVVVETTPVVTPVAIVTEVQAPAQQSSSWFGGWFGSSETTPVVVTTLVITTEEAPAAATVAIEEISAPATTAAATTEEAQAPAAAATTPVVGATLVVATPEETPTPVAVTPATEEVVEAPAAPAIEEGLAAATPAEDNNEQK